MVSGYLLVFLLISSMSLNLAVDENVLFRKPEKVARTKV